MDNPAENLEITEDHLLQIFADMVRRLEKPSMICNCRKRMVAVAHDHNAFLMIAHFLINNERS